MVTEKNAVIEKAEKKRKYLTGKAAEERLQELREKAEFDENSAYAAGKEIGERKGEKRGRKLGLQSGLTKTALAMLKDNVSVDVVKKYTGLNNSVIQSLMKKVQ